MLNSLILTAVVLLFTLAVVLRSKLFAKPTGTYETTEPRQVHVNKHQFDRIGIGDRVTVTRYRASSSSS